MVRWQQWVAQHTAHVGDTTRRDETGWERSDSYEAMRVEIRAVSGSAMVDAGGRVCVCWMGQMGLPVGACEGGTE